MEHSETSDIYKFIDANTDYKTLDTMPIQILVEPYKDIEFRFLRVSVVPMEDTISINFDIELLKSPEGKEVSINDQDFIDFLGNILYDIVVNCDVTVNRTEETAQVELRDAPVDLEADVHEEYNGKNNS